MALLNRIRESVSRIPASISAVEKRVDDHFTHLRELREEKSLYNLSIHITHVRPGSASDAVQSDPDIVALNKKELPIFNKKVNGKLVPVFHSDLGHVHSGRIFPYLSAVREPETLSADEIRAVLAHPKVRESAPQFRKDQLAALLENKRKEESAKSR